LTDGARISLGGRRGAAGATPGAPAAHPRNGGGDGAQARERHRGGGRKPQAQ
jgi:hypothetical protein